MKTFRKSSGGPLKYTNGMPIAIQKPIHVRGNEYYDYMRAMQLGYKPDETGHWPGRDNVTGDYLKLPGHPTIPLSVMYDVLSGYDVTRNEEGRYRSTPKKLQHSNYFQNGGVVGGGDPPKIKPIYVDNANDPRFKAYKDSLNAYIYGLNSQKFAKDELLRLKNKYGYDELDVSQEEYDKYFNNPHIQYTPDTIFGHNHLPPSEHWSRDIVPQTITDYILSNAKKKIGVTEIPYKTAYEYKKPVQPVFVKKPISNNINQQTSQSTINNNAINKSEEPVIYKPKPDPKIVAKQQQLIDAGYDIGTTGADGIWGKKSQAAFEDYQSKESKEDINKLEGMKRWTRAQYDAYLKNTKGKTGNWISPLGEPVNLGGAKGDIFSPNMFGAPKTFKKGGMASEKVINVEGDELEVNPDTLMIEQDFKGLPPHPTNGKNPMGNVAATKSNVIIPKDLRERYIYGNTDEKRNIINGVIQRQIMNGFFKNGGKVNAKLKFNKSNQ